MQQFFVKIQIYQSYQVKQVRNAKEKKTIEECQNIIKTFKLGKTPGNDGLPIEFYNVFWSSIGEMVVESFNEAYEDGEMSNSQGKASLHF